MLALFRNARCMQVDGTFSQNLRDENFTPQGLARERDKLSTFSDYTHTHNIIGSHNVLEVLNVAF